MSTVTIQPGATVFVTGVNGLIGSYIADGLLKKGYNVRGAVRDIEKSKWLHDYFDDKYSAKLDLVAVPDMAVEGCYDDVVKGTSGIIHVASPLNGPNPETTIPIGINSALNILKAAAKTPSITRVVYTSSSCAATMPTHVPKTLDQSSWNEEGIEKGWKHHADTPEAVKGLWLYVALKTASEQACWKWMEENKPSFGFNTILPNCNFSRVLVPEKQGAPSTIAWAKAAFTGEQFDRYTAIIPPQWYISTPDCALLHISALLNPSVTSERIYGFAEKWSYNDLLAIYRKQFPERSFAADVEGDMALEDQTVMPRERAEEVLRWVKGSGWDALEGQVKEMAAQFSEGVL